MMFGINSSLSGVPKQIQLVVYLGKSVKILTFTDQKEL